MKEMSIQLPQLNLPSFQPTLRKKEGAAEIFDVFRKKWVRLSPEEWVRQSFLNLLTEQLHYPSGRIGVEFQVVYSGMSRRADAVAYNESGKPLVIIECKAPNIHINEDVFLQAAMYNKHLQAHYFFLTNGLTHICADISEVPHRVKFSEKIPEYSQL
jgi:hypothetical protein